MATEREITIDQGSRYRLLIDIDSDWLVTADLPSYTGGWMVRDTKNSSTVLADLSPYVEILLNSGQVLLDVPADVSRAWAWRGGAYDVELQHVSDPALDGRLIQGTITVDREVTR